MWNNFQSMVDLLFGFLCKSFVKGVDKMYNHLTKRNPILVFNAQKVLSLVGLLWIIRDLFWSTRDNIRDNLWTFMGSCIWFAHVRDPISDEE